MRRKGEEDIDLAGASVSTPMLPKIFNEQGKLKTYLMLIKQNLNFSNFLNC